MKYSSEIFLELILTATLKSMPESFIYLILYIPTAFILFFKNYLFILLYNIVLALPYIDLNLPWVYMCSPSWNPLHLIYSCIVKIIFFLSFTMQNIPGMKITVCNDFLIFY